MPCTHTPRVEHLPLLPTSSRPLLFISIPLSNSLRLLWVLAPYTVFIPSTDAPCATLIHDIRWRVRYLGCWRFCCLLIFWKLSRQPPLDCACCWRNLAFLHNLLATNVWNEACLSCVTSLWWKLVTWHEALGSFWHAYLPVLRRANTLTISLFTRGTWLAHCRSIGFYKIFDAAVIRAAVLIVDKIVDVWCHSLMILLAVFILSILSRNACLVTIEHSFELLHQVVIHPLL